MGHPDFEAMDPDGASSHDVGGLTLRASASSMLEIELALRMKRR
jgi:hypothetical protein